MFGMGALLLEQAGEAAHRDQAAIFREKREEDAHQETAGRFRIVPALFYAFGHDRQQFRDIAGHTGGVGGGIEAERIHPDRAEPFAHLRLRQILQHDAVAGTIGELGVGLSGAGEIGIDLYAVPDIRYQQEWWPAMINRQCACIAFCLPLGLDHRLGPPRCTPSCGAALHARAGRLAEQVEIVLAAPGREPVCVAALLCLEDEGMALVAVDPAEAGGAIAIVLKNPAFKDIMIVRIVGAASGWRIDVEQAAQAVDETLRVSQLRAAGIAPCGDEVFNSVQIPHEAELEHSDGRQAMAGALLLR